MIGRHANYSTRRIGKSTSGSMTKTSQYLITARYIEGLRDMAKSERVVFMPVRTSRVLGSAGAIKELLSRIGERT